MGGRKLHNFNKALIESIDNAFLALGESVKHAIYWHVEKSYGIKRKEIPKKLNEFHEALFSIFGEGSKVIEKLIVKSLYEKLGLDYKEAYESLSLIEAIEKAKKLIEKKE